MYIFFLFFIRANRQSSFPSSFYYCIISVFYIVFIIFSMLSTYREVSGYISYPKRLLLVKTIETTTFQVYLYKLRVVNVESLINKQWQSLCYHKWLIAEPSLGKSRTSGMLEIFVKELNAVGWNSKPCISGVRLGFQTLEMVEK